ncbi:MAG: hypothetical protein AAGF97_20135 [Planctomycetota bacterium]
METLRDRWSSEQWNQNSVNIHMGATPPPTAGQFYVSIDEQGEDETSVDASQELRERVSIQVAVWRRVADVPQDMTSQVMLPTNIYRATSSSLSAIQRRVIIALHKQYSVMEAYNDKIRAQQGSGENWGIASLPLRYVGRTPNEQYNAANEGGAFVFWLGRRLSFRGLERTLNDLENLT